MPLLLATTYLEDLTARMSALHDQQDAIAKAAELMAKAVAGDHLIYVFGTGHSHMLAEEAHYRAGGLAAMVPVLDPIFMLHDGAVESTKSEREAGHATALLERYAIGPGDVVFVISNSGVNTAPIEAAQHVLAKGASLIAITSQAYSRQAANGRPRIADLAHVVLDNSALPGDASLPTSAEGPRVGPVSTVIGAALINAAMVETVALLQARGIPAPIFISANMPGSGTANAALVERYRRRNPHL